MAEKFYLAMAWIWGFLFALTVFVTPLLGSYLYPKALQWLEAKEKHLGSLSRGLLAGFLWVMPVLVMVFTLIGIHEIAQLLLPFSGAQLSRRGMAWGMGAGLIGGVVIWRYEDRKT